MQQVAACTSQSEVVLTMSRSMCWHGLAGLHGELAAVAPDTMCQQTQRGCISVCCGCMRGAAAGSAGSRGWVGQQELQMRGRLQAAALLPDAKLRVTRAVA